MKKLKTIVISTAMFMGMGLVAVSLTTSEAEARPSNKEIVEWLNTPGTFTGTFKYHDDVLIGHTKFTLHGSCKLSVKQMMFGDGSWGVNTDSYDHPFDLSAMYTVQITPEKLLGRFLVTITSKEGGIHFFIRDRNSVSLFNKVINDMIMNCGGKESLY